VCSVDQILNIQYYFDPFKYQIKTMHRIQREHRIKAMMYRFFSLYESGNTNFALVRELLYADGFVWNSPTDDLIGTDAFEKSFNELDRSLKHSHKPDIMSVDIIDDCRLSKAVHLKILSSRTIRFILSTF